MSPHHNFGKKVNAKFSKYFDISKIKIKVNDQIAYCNATEECPPDISNLEVSGNVPISDEDNKQFDLLTYRRASPADSWLNDRTCC